MQIFSNFGQDQGEKCAEAVKPYHDGPVPSMSIVFLLTILLTLRWFTENPAEFIVYNFSYDVKAHSLQAMKEAKIWSAANFKDIYIVTQNADRGWEKAVASMVGWYSQTRPLLLKI